MLMFAMQVLLFPAMKPDDQQIKAQAASSPGGTDTTAVSLLLF